MAIKLSDAKDIPPRMCPSCGKLLDGATQLRDASEHQETPKAGDATICLYCANVAVFADDLTLRKPTPVEDKQFARDPRMLLAKMAILSMGLNKNDDPLADGQKVH